MLRTARNDRNEVPLSIFDPLTENRIAFERRNCSNTELAIVIATKTGGAEQMSETQTDPCEQPNVPHTVFPI
jgi:hypothetical protein